MKAEEQKEAVVIENLIEGAKELANDVSEALPEIHSKELSGLPVPRLRFEEQVDNLLVAIEKGEAKIPDRRVEQMTAAVARARRKQALVDALQKAVNIARSHVDKDRAEAWADFLGYYAVLAGQAHAGFGGIEAALEPIVEFMSTGPKRVKNDDEETPVAPKKDAVG